MIFFFFKDDYTLDKKKAGIHKKLSPLAAMSKYLAMSCLVAQLSG